MGKRSRSSLADYSESYLDILLPVELPLPKLYKCEECPYSSAYKANVKQHRQRRHLVVPNHLFEKPEVSGVENNIIVTEEENVPAEEMGDMKTMEKVEFENKVECEVCGKKYKNRKTLSGHQYKVHRELM